MFFTKREERAWRPGTGGRAHIQFTPRAHTQSTHTHTHTHITHRERMLLCGEGRLPLTLRNAMEVCEASEEFHTML